MEISKTEKRLSEFNNIIKENDHIYRDIAKNFGLSEGSFWILYSLRIEKETMSQSEICNLMYQPKQTINSALKNLEADGYIELIHTNNRRSKQVKLTQKGISLAENTADKVIYAEQNAMLDLTESEQENFILLFHKYTEALKIRISHVDIKNKYDKGDSTVK